MSDSSILIAGAGAIGSILGGMLHDAGHDVTLLGRRAHLEAIARGGLRISGLLGDRAVAGMTLADDAARLGRRFGLIVCAVKSYDTESIAARLAGRLTDDGAVVSMQNGLGNIESLIESFGRRRVLGTRVIFGAEIPTPGSAHVTVFAQPVAIGPAPAIHREDSPALAARARAIAAMIDAAGVPAVGVDDIMPVLWTKVLYNVALNPLGAILQQHYGALAGDPDVKPIMDRAIEEAFAVARALGIALPFSSVAEYQKVFYEQMIPATFSHRPTMLRDLHVRGRTEIGALNGKIVELADRRSRRGDESDADAADQGRRARAPANTKGAPMKAASIRRASMDAIVAQAECEFPFECCGFIIGDGSVEEVRPVANIQNRMHAEDAAAFPRDARTAFLMEPKEHLAVMLEVDRRKLTIRAVYHSHPDHDAYFSATDRAQACSFDPSDPDYPDIVYIVMSIRAGKFARAAAYAWDFEKKEFAETKLTVE